VINNQPPHDYTKMIINISLEEGLTAAIESMEELKKTYTDASFNFRTIMNAAEFLEQSGKPIKAAELKSLVTLLTSS